MICATVDGSGYVVATPEVFPACGDLMVGTVAQFERLTFWADLAIQLDPEGTDLYLLMGAILGLFVIAFGTKRIARLILNR